MVPECVRWYRCDFVVCFPSVALVFRTIARARGGQRFLYEGVGHVHIYATAIGRHYLYRGRYSVAHSRSWLYILSTYVRILMRACASLNTRVRTYLECPECSNHSHTRGKQPLLRYRCRCCLPFQLRPPERRNRRRPNRLTRRLGITKLEGSSRPRRCPQPPQSGGGYVCIPLDTTSDGHCCRRWRGCGCRGGSMWV